MFPAYAYLSAYDRHKKLINDYFTLYGGSVSSLKRDTKLKLTYVYSKYESLVKKAFLPNVININIRRVFKRNVHYIEINN